MRRGDYFGVSCKHTGFHLNGIFVQHIKMDLYLGIEKYFRKYFTSSFENSIGKVPTKVGWIKVLNINNHIITN